MKTGKSVNYNLIVTDKVFCDVCRAEIVAPGLTEIREVSVTMRRGEKLAGYNEGTIYEIDLCPKCFETELVPFLRSIGAEVEEVEFDS